jgi:hypothetical protein
MAELLMAFEQPVQDKSGTYHVRAVGHRADDGMWEGWLEFVSLATGEVLVSRVESRQPEREHLVYWATGLSNVYLEGALDRARHPLTVRVRAAETPASTGPAAPTVVVRPEYPRGPEPVLDPFEIGSRNLDILRQELTALDRPRLFNLIAAYDLNPARESIDWLTDAQLVHFIVVAVDTQLPQRAKT